MRIVIATAVYHPMINGVAVFSYNLARGLVGRGHEVMVICPSQNGKNYTEIEDGVKVCRLKSVQAKIYPDQIHPVPKKRKLFYKHGFRVSVFPQREIKRALNSFQPDVVHVQVSDPIGLSVVGYARRHQIPVVTTEHNQPDVITDQLKLGLLKKPVDALLSAYFVNRQSKSDFVTMPTKKAIEDLVWSRGKDFNVPIAAVSNGVDLSSFKPGRPSAEFYKKYGLNENCKTVLNLGRVDPEKNVGMVVEAFLLAEKKLDDVQLLIVGDGTDRVRLEEKTAGCKNIHFAGRVTGDELYKIYQLGDVFATASEIETQGIVLIEAAASGLPLIAVDAGAVSDVCIDGENGFLCRPGDVKEMSEAMVTILNDDKMRKEYSKHSLEISKEHDFEKTLDKFINIYNKVLNDKV